MPNWIGGSGKVKKLTNKEGKVTTVVSLSLKKEDLDKLYVGPKGYVAIELYKKPEPDQYKNEFSIMENEWQVGKRQEEGDQTLNEPADEDFI